jgi:hypothetical protein
MRHWILAVGLVLMLAARPADAQTRVAVVVGFGVPHPFVTGVVVVGRPRAYYPRRAHFYRPPLFVERVNAVRHHHRHHYRRDHDDDE